MIVLLESSKNTGGIMGNKSRIGKKEEPSPSASEAEASFLEKIARHSLYPVHIIGAGSSYWELRIDKIGGAYDS